MDVAGHAGARRASKIHAKIHPVRFVICSISGLNALREPHYFAQSVWIASAEFRHVRVRNDHDVPGSIRITIKNDEDFRAAIHDQCFGVVFTGGSIAKNAVRLYAACCLFHVLVAPGSPEIVHEVAYASKALGSYLRRSQAMLTRRRGRRRKRFRHPRCSQNLSALCSA